MSTLLRAALPPSAEDLALASPLDDVASNQGREWHRRPFSRFSAHLASPPDGMEECLVMDARATLSPAQMVEQKLVVLLKGKMLPLSHIQSTGAPWMRRGSAQSASGASRS
jgi:hypothetical protein